MESLGGRDEVALKAGRLDDIHGIEKMSWGNLLRIKQVIVPIVELRTKEVTRYAKMEVRQPTGSINYQEVELKNEENPLDELARDYTPAEADLAVKRFVEISDRLHRAWMFNGRLNGLLLKSMGRVLEPKTVAGERKYGGLTEVKINGRTYITWVGRGGIFKNDVEKLTRVWPCPLNRRISGSPLQERHRRPQPHDGVP